MRLALSKTGCFLTKANLGGGGLFPFEPVTKLPFQWQEELPGKYGFGERGFEQGTQWRFLTLTKFQAEELSEFLSASYLCAIANSPVLRETHRVRHTIQHVSRAQQTAKGGSGKESKNVNKRQKASRRVQKCQPRVCIVAL